MIFPEWRIAFQVRVATPCDGAIPMGAVMWLDADDRLKDRMSIDRVVVRPRTTILWSGSR